MGIIGAFPPTGNYQLHSPLSHNRSPCSCTARLPPGTRKFIQQMGFVNILIVHVLGHCCSLSRDIEETKTDDDGKLGPERQRKPISRTRMNLGDSVGLVNV